MLTQHKIQTVPDRDESAFHPPLAQVFCSPPQRARTGIFLGIFPELFYAYSDIYVLSPHVGGSLALAYSASCSSHPTLDLEFALHPWI